MDIGILGNKLRQYLQDKQFTFPTRASGEFVGSVAPLAQVLGNKDNVRVWFNIPALALNSTGQDPDKVIQVFKEIIKGMEELGYDLEASIVFYEVLVTVIVKSSARPTDKINKAMKINLSSLQKLGTVVVDSFRIVNENPNDETGVLNLVVEPNPSNPEKSYQTKLQYRCPKPAQVESFHADLKGRIIDVMQSIEAE